MDNVEKQILTGPYPWKGKLPSIPYAAMSSSAVRFLQCLYAMELASSGKNRMIRATSAGMIHPPNAKCEWACNTFLYDPAQMPVTGAERRYKPMSETRKRLNKEARYNRFSNPGKEG